MKITIEFETSNAAFDVDPEPEIREILERVGRRVIGDIVSLERSPKARVFSSAIMDSNGNTIGRITCRKE